jgi:hypothetical protein
MMISRIELNQGVFDVFVGCTGHVYQGILGGIYNQSARILWAERIGRKPGWSS